MKALFIGGTGLISTAVSALAVERGWELYLLNRGKSVEDGVSKIPEGAKVITGNIKKPEEVKAALGEQTFDVVVNWINFVPADIERDIELFAGKCKQYIFISSASVYQKPSTHYLIREDTPLANPYWDYSRNKIAAEERLLHEYRDNGFPATIVRPSLTYGDPMIPHVCNSWNMPWTLIDRLRKGKKVLAPGDGTSLWGTTHNTDFAKGFVGLMGHPQTLGQAFHITTDEVLTWDQMTHIIADCAGTKADIVHVPSEFISAFMPWELGSTLGDKSQSVVFDNSKLKTFVPEFRATKSFADGIRQSIAWFEADASRQKIDEDWNATVDKMIDAYESILPKA